MLIESTFRIGGILMLAVAVLLVGGLTVTGFGPSEPGLYIPLVGCFLVGVLFLVAARGAAEERRKLLALGADGIEGPDRRRAP